MKYTSAPGVFDILPNGKDEPWRTSSYWQHVEALIRRTAEDFCYREVRTPIFERADLFQRSVGEGTDIVSKEMYIFEDKGNRQMALRPEGTAPVMRAFVEGNLAAEGPLHKLYYIAPMFRYDRPQAGRYRQHHQFGAEAIGNPSPEQDVEVIDFLYSTLSKLGIKDLTILLNCLGDASCRESYKNALVEFLTPFAKSLSADSQRRLEKNPLRVLDSKEPQDIEITRSAPSILDFLSSKSYAHFQRVKELLTELKIPFRIEERLVRGLDYYNDTVFEIVTKDLGSQSSLGGGGRYDGLIKEIGGPDLPSVGFGCGIERIIQTALKQGVTFPQAKPPLLFLIPMGDSGRQAAFILLHQLREQGIRAQMELSDRKVGKSMQFASGISAKYVAVIGDNEITSKEVDLKEMATGSTIKISIDSLIKKLKDEMSGGMLLNLPEIPLSGSPEEVKKFMDDMQKSLGETKEATEAFHKTLEDVKKLFEES